MNLEDIVKKSGEGLRWYGNSIKDNYKELVPSLVVSTLVGAGFQEASGWLGDFSEVVTQSVGYFGVMVGGFGTFLGLKKHNNPEDYPNGFWSKEMLKTFGDAWSADYMSDLVAYTPVFIPVNHYMMESGAGEGISGLVAFGAASTTYFFVMCGMYDRTKKLSDYVTQNAEKAIRSCEAFFDDSNTPNLL